MENRKINDDLENPWLKRVFHIRLFDNVPNINTHSSNTIVLFTSI